MRALIRKIFLLFLILYWGNLVAAQVTTIGQMATLISSSISAITKMIFGISYIAGIGFAFGAIMKFKQHKDNPTQIPIGTPVALLFVASGLLFLPTVLGISGMSIFGTTQTAGPMGTVWGT